MGGVDSVESLYAGGKRRRKTRARKTRTGGKRALKSYGGIKTGRHNWGANAGLSKRKNTPRYGWSQK